MFHFVPSPASLQLKVVYCSDGFTNWNKLEEIDVGDGPRWNISFGEKSEKP